MPSPIKQIREMASFFLQHDYSTRVVERALKPFQSALYEVSTAQVVQAATSERSTNQSTIPLVLTYHPLNGKIKRIMTANNKLLRDDPDTGDICASVRIPSAYRRDSSL